MNDAASVQLRRILLALPHLADGEAYELDALAARIGCDRDTLLRDLTTLLSRDFEPPAFVEGVQLYIDGTSVSMVSSTFRRPMRLSATELAAIDLGLAMLTAERAPDERPTFARTREQLRALRVSLPGDVVEADIRSAALGAYESLPALPVLRDAAGAQHPVRILYLRAHGTAPSERVVHPYALLNAEGLWYLAGHCEASADVRIFRVDRIVSAEAEEGHFERPATWRVDDVVSGRRVLRTDAPLQLRVWYGPRVARWITEREGAVPAADGSVEVTYPLADVAWAVRHVLQYGPDAEVLEPAEVRLAVLERLRRMAALTAHSANG
jgi:predicted DNA-binding transcriptional regulator YafY